MSSDTDTVQQCPDVAAANLEESGIPQGFNEVLKRYFPMVRFLIGKLTKYALTERASTIDDMLQIGRIALWEATQRYDPARSKFSTFATRRITGALLDELRKNSVLSRLDSKRFSELQKFVDKWLAVHDQPPSLLEKSSALGVPVETVVYLETLTLALPLPVNLREPLEIDDTNTRNQVINRDTPESEASLRELLSLLEQNLHPRTSAIFERFVSGDTKSQIALSHGVSEAYIGQIVNHVIRKIRPYLGNYDGVLPPLTVHALNRITEEPEEKPEPPDPELLLSQQAVATIREQVLADLNRLNAPQRFL